MGRNYVCVLPKTFEPAAAVCDYCGNGRYSFCCAQSWLQCHASMPFTTKIIISNSPIRASLVKRGIQFSSPDLICKQRE